MSLFETRKVMRTRRTRSTRNVVLPILQLHKLECKACPLDKVVTNKNSHMEPTGAKKPLVYMLGEAPGETEDEQGEQFVGKAGKLLRQFIPREYRDRLRWNNCVRTRPPKNRTPDQVEIECCKPSILRDIEETKPKAIFGFGNIPLGWALGVDRIMAWRGRHAPVKIGKHTCWFFPMLHPSFIARSRYSRGHGVDAISGDEWERLFRTDLVNAFKVLHKLPDPFVVDSKTVYDDVELLYKPAQVEKVLRRLLDEELLGIDLETTHLRPYEDEAKILSCSIGEFSDGVTYAFPLHHKGNKLGGDVFQNLLHNFLLEYTGVMVAQNSSFEMEWLGTKMEPKVVRVADWQDTMQQAYILDERSGGTQKLNALCILHFGLPLKSLSDVNTERLAFEPLEKVLKYNALDTKYTLPLFVKHEALLEEAGSMAIYKEQMRRVATVTLTQMKGMCVNFKRNRELKVEVTSKIADMRGEIQNLKITQEYIKRFGPFSPTSPVQVTRLLKEVLKDETGKKGEKYSSSADVLEQIDHPFAKMITELRTLEKLRSTYIDILDEKTGDAVCCDGKVHCNFNTTFTSTGRTSSSDPNMQNFPKRDHAYIRSQLVPSPGNILVAVDQGQIEARGIAIESKDPVLVKALWDRYDIHMAWAERIAELSPSTWLGCDKDIDRLRHRAKNELVFPLFYGSERDSVARAFEWSSKIASTIYDEFWDMFKGVRRWQKKCQELYAIHGYVEALTGRRRHAPLSKNMVINSPIQGLASDIVIYGMNALSEKSINEDRPDLQPILNIHDDLTFDIPESKLDDCIVDIVKGTLDIPWDWINVPLQVEVSIGKNWFELEKFGKFFSDEL